MSPDLGRTPFVGRADAMRALHGVIEVARGGRSTTTVVVGDPGIGKTRLLDELCHAAIATGCTVLRGGCDEGVAGASHVALGRAIEQHVRLLDPGIREAELGGRVAVLARIAPALSSVVPDASDLAPLSPDEERRRLVDAVVQVVAGAARRAPVVIVIDDGHWADRGTLSLLHHLATRARVGGVAVVVATRPDPFERSGNATDGLRLLRGDPGTRGVALSGLSAGEVAELAQGRLGGAIDGALVDALMAQTEGNPFFVGELLTHLTTNDRLRFAAERWTLDDDELGVPPGVRAMVSQRVGRLSNPSQRMLDVAAAFDGGFPLTVVAQVAGLGEGEALDALDEVLAAGLVEHSAGVDTYDFTHALIRHAVADAQLTSRRVVVHRRVAEALVDPLLPRLDPVDPATVAAHYASSAALPGAEAGVPWALEAASRAEATLGYSEAARLLELVFELDPTEGPDRPDLLARLAIDQAYAGDPDAATANALNAAEAIGDSRGASAAVTFLDQAATALQRMGEETACWVLAGRGLEIGSPVDPGRQRPGPGEQTAAWARLMVIDQRRRMAVDPLALASVDDQEWADLKRLLLPLPPSERVVFLPAWSSRAEALAAPGETTSIRFYTAGELASTVPVAAAEYAAARASGAIGLMVGWAGSLSRALTSVGRLAESRQLVEEIDPLAFEFAGPMPFFIIWLGARDELRLATNEGWDTALADFAGVGQPDRAENAWAAGPIRATAARVLALQGDVAAATALVDQLVPLLEDLPGWTANYTRMAADVANVLWLIGDHPAHDVIAHNIRTKIVEPDFRFPMFDGRLSLARLAAVAGDLDEALRWFAAARAVFDDQGALPLRAICDFDEATTRLRAGDTAAADALRMAAVRQFDQLGMTGWSRAAT